MAAGEPQPDPGPPRPITAAELDRVLSAERELEPFLVVRDGGGALRTLALAGERVRLGRDPALEVAVSHDETVSRLHAELQRAGDGWLVVDDGLSRNGTFVNGERVAGRRRLEDGDALRIGATVLVFRAPLTGTADHTRPAPVPVAVEHATETQRRILRALCAPLGRRPGLALPATNGEVAAAVHLSVDAVKAHLRVLFDRFGLAELPPGEKRIRLAEAALRTGLASGQPDAATQSSAGRGPVC